MHINFIEICETFYTHEERIPWVFKHPYLESTAILTRTYTCVLTCFPNFETLNS